MSRPFSTTEVIEETEFLFQDPLPPGQINAIHRACLRDLDRLAGGETLYFIIGSYSAPQKDRVEAVRDKLSEPVEDVAFILEEIDPKTDAWENFYVKFRVFLSRCHYVIGVFENNDGGHELEIGEADLSVTYVLKRDYTNVSIDNDIEYEKYDAMLGTLFDLLDRRDQLFRWETEDELYKQTQWIGYYLGSAEKPEES